MYASPFFLSLSLHFGWRLSRTYSRNMCHELILNMHNYDAWHTRLVTLYVVCSVCVVTVMACQYACFACIVHTLLCKLAQQFIVYSVPSKNNSRLDGRARLEHGLWSHQSFWALSFPTLKKICPEGLQGQQYMP